MRPRTATRPFSGCRTPEIVRSSVDCPAPLRPITPSTEPFGTEKETSRSAGITRSDDFVRLNRSMQRRAPSAVEMHAIGRRHVVDFDRGRGTGRGLGRSERSETDCKGSFMRHEHPIADDEEEHGPAHGDETWAAVGTPPVKIVW